ncbi:hypothetical protein AAX26_01883 [Aliarcobacter thereius]|uniref:hypothetical protein n=1 Tax=Aliarcobacter thereius TaxID=544718 RepID=UPI000828D852|nr:hypothetical protein [Aliarcobacter thereius]OCL85457.1 hypothetical protein AAX26_01883 [Aliarcobacter thereius]
MPQLIAMIIIVVGAMIYMFQTFGGTGDKISGIAQKTSVVTEINNIKSGLQFAARAGKIATTNDTASPKEYFNTLIGLAEEGYFADQMNEQITRDKDNAKRTEATFNTYSAISFGGNSENAGDGKGAMLISLVANTEGMIPGIFVDLNRGSLKDNAGFLESEIANDLKDIATIDRLAATGTAGTAPTAGALKTGANLSSTDLRTPVASTGGANNDGMFIIYFKDFGANEVVVKK